MRYLKQTTSIIILCGILGILATLGGCTAEDGTDSSNGNGTAADRVPLSIRATANGFDGLPETEKSGTPLTRTPVENGNTTTFSNGDVIGIFAIKNNAIADGISNAKLTYSASADGAAGSWNPEAGTTLYWYEGVSYVAYYPYKDGITIDATQTTEQIIASLAAHSSLQPTTDQSSSDGSTANYTACDLMTASGAPTADGSNPRKPILTLNFEHQFALLVLEPQIYTPCTAPADGGFVYRTGSEASMPYLDVKSATINGVTACPMPDGTYRVLVTPSTSSARVTGSYLTSTDNKKVSFNGSSISGGFVAGHCYKVAVKRSTHATESVVRPLAPGDFVFQNESEGRIEVYPGDGPLTSWKIPDYSEAVGMVVTVASSGRLTDTQLNDKGWNHAYVMGLVNCGESAIWGPDIDESILPNTVLDDHAEDNMNGYSETEKMLEAHKDDLSSYGVFDAINTYRTDNPVPAGLSSARSPWFVPSVGQWFDVMANICGRSPKTFRNNTAYGWVDNAPLENTNSVGANMITKIDNQLRKANASLGARGSILLWCSSEADASNGWNACWYTAYYARVGLEPIAKPTSTTFQYAVRPFFAF